MYAGQTAPESSRVLTAMLESMGTINEEYAERYIIPRVHQIVQDAHHADNRRKTAFTLTPVHQAQGEHCINALSIPVQHLRHRSSVQANAFERL